MRRGARTPPPCVGREGQPDLDALPMRMPRRIARGFLRDAIGMELDITVQPGSQMFRPIITPERHHRPFRRAQIVGKHESDGVMWARQPALLPLFVCFSLPFAILHGMTQLLVRRVSV